jgi:hypothetical protein
MSNYYNTNYEKINLNDNNIIIPFRIEDNSGSEVNFTGILYPKIYYYSELKSNSSSDEYIYKKTKILPFHECTENDFKGKKDTKLKNLGFFDDILTLLYKKNQTSYYVKIIEKKNIINNSYQNILNINYKISNNESNSHFDDYTINLETQWEDNERLFLVFEGIKRYMLLEKLIKKMQII